MSAHARPGRLIRWCGDGDGQTLTTARVPNLFGEDWDAFRRARTWFDPTNAFENAMTKQIGLP